MQRLKEFIDLFSADGTHIILSLFLLFSGLFCLKFWGIAEGKELFIFALGILARSMNPTGKANGNPPEIPPAP